MPLLDLPNELLEDILVCVAPNDLINFVLSCKLLHSLATKRLQEHKVLEKRFKRVDSNRGPFRANQFSELLHQILIEPRMADYVQQISIDDWYWRLFDPNEDDGDEQYCPPYPYTDLKMEAFEKAVKETGSIPFKEKERWISQIKAGDENPVLALLLPRLHYLTSIRIYLRSVEDDFLFQTLGRAFKEPRSPSLSRLLEVEILGANVPMHYLCLLTVFAALPSVTSLKAHGLVEDGLWRDSTFSLIPCSSNLRDLTLEGCTVSRSALFNLIKSAKSLRSFTFSYPGDHLSSLRNEIPSSFTWAPAALLQYASTSLEELTLRRSHFNPDLNRTECSFKSYQNLRVLTIDYAHLMGDKICTTNKISTVLPASLEILNLFGCHIYGSGWFKELVKWVVRVKERTVPCLKELNFKETSGLYQCNVEDMRELCAAAMEVGFELKVISKVSDARYAWAPDE